MFIITKTMPKYGAENRKPVEVFRCETYSEACIEYEKKYINNNDWNIYEIKKI